MRQRLILGFLELSKYHTDEAIFAVDNYWPGSLGYEIGALHGELGNVLYEIAMGLDG